VLSATWLLEGAAVGVALSEVAATVTTSVTVTGAAVTVAVTIIVEDTDLVTVTASAATVTVAGAPGPAEQPTQAKRPAAMVVATSMRIVLESDTWTACNKHDPSDD